MNKSKSAFVISIAVSFFFFVDSSVAADWPQWRGPLGTGVSEEVGLPLTWSETSSIAWTAPLSGWGTSTPVIWGDAIFLTSQQDDRLLLLRLNKQDGHVDWTREIGVTETKRAGETRSEQKFHELHNNASPSPVVDGERVICHFGNGELVAYDFDGGEIWRRNLQTDHGPYSVWWGHANSPVLYGNLVISVCMQDSLEGVSEPQAESYLVAHDKRTGRQKWKTDRRTKAKAEECDSYTTPVGRATKDGWELIVMGGNQLDAYDAVSGKQRWFLPGLVGGRTITGPIVAGDMAFATRGMRGELVAVSLDQETEGALPNKRVAWRDHDGTPDSCSPVAWGEYLFTITDDGIAKCYNLRRGQLKWKERLKGKYKASPVAAEGRVYFLNMEGLCTVVAADDRFQSLASNSLPDATLASIAISDGKLFIRGKERLFCVKK